MTVLRQLVTGVMGALLSITLATQAGVKNTPPRYLQAASNLGARGWRLYALVILVIRLIWGLPVQGWAPLMMAVLVLGGIQMVMLGVIGEYLWRILAQARAREPFIVESMYGDLPTIDTPLQQAEERKLAE